MKKVIFDMDGVIVDSEPYYKDLYEVLYKKHGIYVLEEEKDSFVGCPSTNVWLYLKEKHNLPQSIEVLTAMESDGYYEFIQTVEDLEPIEGIQALLETFKNNGVKCSVASSSTRRVIEYVVEKLQIKQYFDHIISGDEVEHGKPAPDIFLEIAKRYGNSPKEFLVIEDSCNGVTAAKTAGMTCVGYQNANSGNQDISKADLIIDKFSKENIKAILQIVKN